MGTADRRNKRSPQMTGDADPRPGISTFQRMFFVSLHSTGGVAVFETPVAYGPRHCGQNRSAGDRELSDCGIAAPSASAHRARRANGTSIGACSMTEDKGQGKAPASESAWGWGPTRIKKS